MVWTPFTRADHDRSSQRYASDMTDREWRFFIPFMPIQPAKGRKRRTDLRSVVDAVFYLLQSGCQWGLLPKDFPPKSTVHHYFKRFCGDGTWSRIHDALLAARHLLFKAGWFADRRHLSLPIFSFLPTPLHWRESFDYPKMKPTATLLMRLDVENFGGRWPNRRKLEL